MRLFNSRRPSLLSAHLMGIRRRASRPCPTYRPQLEGLETRILLDVNHWVNPAGGAWNVAANWESGHVPAPADDVVIGQTRGPIVHDMGTDTIHSLRLDSTLQVTGSTLTVSDTATIHGSVEVSAAGFNGASLTAANELTLDGTVRLSSNFFGGGQIRTPLLDGSGFVFLLSGDSAAGNAVRALGSGAALMIGDGITIAGAGTVGSADTNVVNRGTLLANVPGGTLALTGTGWVNAGTLQANFGSTIDLGGTMNNAASPGTFAGGGFFAVSGRINGGTLDLPAGAKLHGADGTLNGVTVNGDIDLTAMGFGSSNLNIINGLTFNGAATLTGSFFGTSLLRFNGTQTLDGTATILFTGTFVNSVQVMTDGSTLTIGPGITIHGQTGTVGGTGAVTFVNQGVIRADVPGGTVTLSGAGWSNVGTVQAVNGGTILAQGTTRNFSNGTLLGGAWQVSAYSTLRLLNADILTIAATVVLNGLNSNWYRDTATTNGLANLAINADAFTIDEGRDFIVAGSFGNVGSMTVGNGSRFTVGGSYTQLAGSTALTGGVLAAGIPGSLGAVNIQAGTLAGWGTILADVTNAGLLTVGDGVIGRTLNIGGNYRQSGTGVLSLAIGTPDSGGSDRLNVTGRVFLDGTLDITARDSYFASQGDQFQILTFGSSMGRFAQMSFPDLGTDLILDAVYDPNDLTLVVNGRN